MAGRPGRQSAQVSAELIGAPSGSATAPVGDSTSPTVPRRNDQPRRAARQSALRYTGNSSARDRRTLLVARMRALSIVESGDAVGKSVAHRRSAPEASRRALSPATRVPSTARQAKSRSSVSPAADARTTDARLMGIQKDSANLLQTQCDDQSSDQQRAGNGHDLLHALLANRAPHRFPRRCS